MQGTNQGVNLKWYPRGQAEAFSASGWNSGIVDKSKAKSNFAIGTHKLPGSGLPKMITGRNGCRLQRAWKT